jgi:hypothetical protein
MSSKTRVGLLAGAAALTLTGVSVAGPAPETTNNSDLAQRLKAAEEKIAQMENASNQNWLTEQRADEIKGLVQDVLADADTRASLLQSGMTAGYDNGFILGSADGNWLLKTNFLMQQRFIWNYIDEGSDFGIDQNHYGFENTRSKFILSGHVVNPQWFYLVSINVGNSSSLSDDEASGDERTGVGNAYLGYDYGGGWSIQMGSMKLPFLREELVDAQYQLAIERSVVNYNFTLGYSDALMLNYTGEAFRFNVAFSDGFQMGSTPWTVGPTSHAEYAFTGRGEFKVSGNWDQFKDFTSPRGGETGILLGAAAHWEKSEFGTGDPEFEYVFLTGDVSMEFGGFNLFGSITWTDVDSESATVADSNPLGVVFQGGFYLAETWELYGRFEWENYDVDDVDDLILLTIGVNKYFAGHNAVWTTDVGYAFNDVISNNTITGWRTDAPDQDGQVVIRTQWQLLF